MSQQFYKPNPRNTGSACSFWVDSQNSFMSSLIKQFSWNDQTKNGSFSENKDNPKAKVIVKFSPSEIAEIINAIERNTSFDAYHRSEKQVTQIGFGPYIKKQKQGDKWVEVGEQLGFSYRITKQAKDDSTNKVSLVVGFTWGEAKLLKMYLEEGLRFSFDYRERDYKPQDSSSQNSSTSAPAKKKAAKKATVPTDDDDLEW